MSNAKITFLFLKLTLSVFNNASLLLLLFFSAETTVVYRQRFVICVQTSFCISIHLSPEFSMSSPLIVRCSILFSRIYFSYCILTTFFPLWFGVLDIIFDIFISFSLKLTFFQSWIFTSIYFYFTRWSLYKNHKININWMIFHTNLCLLFFC